MLETDRRSFVKGLFFAASAALISGTPVLAKSLDLAKAEVYWIGPDGRQIITFNDKNDPHHIFRDYIEEGLKWLNMNTLEPNDPFFRLKAVNYLRFRPMQMLNRRFIIDYSVVCDERNNLNDMIQRNAKAADVYLKPTLSTGLYGFRFGYDPHVV